MNNEVKPADSNQITREYFDSLVMEMRHIGNLKPTSDITLYGKNFSTPIMTAALSHLSNTCPDGDTLMAKGAYDAGAVEWTGMGSKEELESIIATGASTIKIIKPYADNDLIFEKIEHAQKSGAFAVGMDIDHAFTGSGDYDDIRGSKMVPKSLTELKSFAAATNLPFIVKGILSVTDAKKCLDLGAGGIVVSHHHGIMNSAIPPLMILPDIADAIEGKMPIFVDCGIMNGYDVFKALALGADAVCVGRILMDYLKQDGSEGVTRKINSMTSELMGVMARTGFSKIDDIDSSVLRQR